MEVKAKLNNLRIAPRKVRLVADLIRGKNVNQAERILSFCVKRGTLPLKKLLQSCVQNGKNNFQLEEANLFVKEIKVDEGRKLKRWHPMSRGRAGAIQKKTSSVSLVLADYQKEKLLLKTKNNVKGSVVSEREKTIKNKNKAKDKKKFTSFENKKIQNKANLKQVFRRKAI
ncbi:50S ribosomal protein L22 [Candidatus Gribaldobacteria bacterium]|nr:50S ribosomal protein L22 [Candidatus Gribaldobacteria bacterium]